MAARAKRQCRNADFYGVLLYKAIKAIDLHHARGFPLGPGAVVPRSVLDMTHGLYAEMLGGGSGLFGQLVSDLMPAPQKIHLIHLDGFFAGQVLRGERTVFHAVCITQKVNWQRVPGRPPDQSHVRNFKRQVGQPGDGGPPPGGDTKIYKHPEGTWGVDDVIDWLFASRHLQNSEDHLAGGFDFAQSKEPSYNAV